MKAANIPLREDAPASSFLAAPVHLSGTRRAALFLHALPRSDRDWVMGKLNDADRASVELLLLELESLGIPADREMLDEAIAGSQEPPAGSLLVDAVNSAGPRGNRGYVTTQLELLAAADPLLIASVLRHEPAGLTARLLMLQQWPWRDLVLRELGPVKRRNIEDRLVGLKRQTEGLFAGLSDSSASSLSEHLLEHLLSRLRCRQSVLRQEQRPSRTSWLSRILQRLAATGK